MKLSRELRAASLRPIILTILSDGDAYGYQIVQRVRKLSDGKMKWSNGTLYPLLHDLEHRKLVKSYWRETPTAPRRKYYCLTTKGEQALASEKAQWLDVHAMLVRLWGLDLQAE
ncbi:MAG: helix-turn-helix transcriptional regulator [Rhodothermales bacterium]